MRTKMADEVLHDEGRKVVVESKMVKESVEVLDIMRKECVKTKGLCSIKSKFYLSGESENYGANFRVNGVGLRVHASEKCDEHVSEFSADFKSLCSSGDDSVRKKRCTDRYDSSESSDSGVAALSSIDCSTSSGNSDITDPGSPYSSPSSATLRSPASGAASAASAASSSASEESDDSRTGSPAIPQRGLRRPASTQPSAGPGSPEAPPTPPGPPGDEEDDEARPPDPWLPGLWEDDDGGGGGCSIFVAAPTPSSSSAQKRLFHHSSCTASLGAFKSMAKRLKASSSGNNSGVASTTYKGHFQSLLQCFQGKSAMTPVAASRNDEEDQDNTPSAVARHADVTTATGGLPQTSRVQGKITEYFKTQMKPPSASKCSGSRKEGRFVASRTGGAGGPLTAVVADSVGSKVVESGLVDKYYGFSPAEACSGEHGGSGGVLASVVTGGFVKERLESSGLMEVKGMCANGRVGGTMRGPEVEMEAVVASGEAKGGVPVMSAPASLSSSAIMPAPILSAPKTIRFPAMQRSSGNGSKVIHSNGTAQESPSAICHWSECKLAFDCGTQLLEHLQLKHVNSQVEGSENFVCLWVGCKVYARTSCSRSWLERHVLSHGGNKPFRCIFDGCGQRFSSQTMLERHVNGHFNAGSGSQSSCTSGTSGSVGVKRSLDATPNKPFRRNGKKLRYRRRPWSARMFDYFDAGVMEELQHRLVAVTEKELMGQVTPRGDEILLTSKVLARRMELDGTTKILLRWYPEDILPDEWVSESEVKPRCTFPIRTLPPSTHSSLCAALFGTAAPKHRRKTKAQVHSTPPSSPGSPLSGASSSASTQQCSSASSSLS